MIYRAQIVSEAREWIGTPWKHQASVKGVGCDCIGLIRGIARAVGLTDPFVTGEAARFAGYGRTPDADLLLEACGDYLDPGQGALGDILVMRFEKEPQHFALISCLAPRRIIHAYAQARKVAENGMDRLWLSRIVRTYSFRGIDG
jgi:NlpC/P60 family putative phage cell wall peptidase